MSNYSRKYKGRRRARTGASGAVPVVPMSAAEAAVKVAMDAFARRDVAVVEALVEVIMSYEPGVIAYDEAFSALVAIMGGPVFGDNAPTSATEFTDAEMAEFDRFVRLDDKVPAPEEVAHWVIVKLKAKGRCPCGCVGCNHGG